MAEYQKIEYRIGKDGKVTEVVLNGSGTSCTGTTQGLETALGKVEARELLPEYYDPETEGVIGLSQEENLELQGMNYD